MDERIVVCCVLCEGFSVLCEAVDERGEWRKLGSVRRSRDQESQREADKESRQGG